ncbi:CPBP family glutamic-type intramembrane protease [Larkinella soli]|uniref:CPBP family glutamic-type intramembrane protease n=1 Tax=Larkinella soli TaxID=1770527 RepID=UPI000FFC1EF3
MILVTGVAAPLLETLVFQTFVLWLLRNFNVKLKFIVASLLFSVNHAYSLKHMILSLFLGYVFNFSYEFSERRKWCPFGSVTLIHSIYNLFVTLVYLTGSDR